MIGNVLMRRRTKAVKINNDDNMVLVLHWDGTVAPSSNLWYDDSGDRYFTITNGTHGDDYYEFINNKPTAASSYGKSGGESNGQLPDLGYHWKVVVDLAIRIQSTNPSTFSPIDFGSFDQVSAGKCAFMIGMSNSSQKWSMNAKFNGNSSASTYNPALNSMPAESFGEVGTWLRRTITCGVRASQTQGKDETFYIVSGLGECKSSTPYNPLRFNRWENYIWLGRSRISPNTSNKYSTSTRIYDIKVYSEPIS